MYKVEWHKIRLPLKENMCYCGRLIWIFMRSLNPWPLFPSPLSSRAGASLSLQFLLQELVSFLRWLNEVETRKQEESPQTVYLNLEKILLFSLEHPLSQQGGFLDKLSFYANILLANSSDGEDADILTYLKIIEESVLEFRNELFHRAKRADLSLEIIEKTWKRLIQTAEQNLKQLFYDLFSFFQEFCQDENVLFLLIEQKELLNQYLGHETVERVLARLFPGGASALRETLYHGYARRGFLDFYSRNEELIQSVDWKDACPLSNPKPGS